MLFCSCRDEKDKWIRAKYELCEFLPSLPHGDIALSQASCLADVLRILVPVNVFWYMECCNIHLYFDSIVYFEVGLM